MKKVIALTTVLMPSSVLAHSNTSHSIADFFPAHFLTQIDHIAMIIAAVVVIFGAVKYAVKKVKVDK